MRSFTSRTRWVGILIVAAGPLGACESDCVDCEGQTGDAWPDAGGSIMDAAPASPEAGSDGPANGGPDAAQQPRDAAPLAEGGSGDADAAIGGDAGVAADAGARAPANYPAELLDLRSWKLTVPVDTDHPGSPDEYRNPELQTLSIAPHFTLNGSRSGVIFQAHAGGATTVSSSYPRSELREMTPDGIGHAAWSTLSGTHRMRVRQAITHLTAVKPHVVSAQIHDSEDDVVMVRLQEQDLFVESNGTRLATLDPDYALGTIFTLEIVAENGSIEVLYNGESKVSLQRAAVGCYFKAGCYTQTNVERGDAPEDYAEVVIHELSVTHD